MLEKIDEIDFVVEYESELLPIEIKSGKGYKNHNALNDLFEIKGLKIEKSIVFCINHL